MKLKLHHLNLCTTNVPAMDEFYRSVLDMAPEPSMNALRVTRLRTPRRPPRLRPTARTALPGALSAAPCSLDTL